MLIARIATVSLVVLALIWRPLVLECVDPGFLRSVSRAGAPAHIAFLALVVLNLVGGFQALGTLLAVGIMMLPAVDRRASGRATSPRMIAVAVGCAALSGYAGLLRLLSRQPAVRPGDHSGGRRALRRFGGVRAGRRADLRRLCRGAISKRERTAETMHDVTRRSVLLAAPGLPRALLAAPALAQGKIKVVASFSILGDLVRNVGGDRVEIATLVGPNGDAHVYSPTPADAKTLAAAKVVFVNGLGFEGWIDAAGQGLRHQGADRRRQQGDQAAQDGGRAPARPTVTDPHAWQSVANAKIYVANIRDGLSKADPAGKSAYEANAAGLSRQARCARTRGEGARSPRFPPTAARIITTHDAFGYFGDAYGMEFIAPEGVSTDVRGLRQGRGQDHRADQEAEDPGGVHGEHHRPAADAADRQRDRRQDRRHALFRRAVASRAARPAATST